jgi:hypothetical protein
MITKGRMLTLAMLIGVGATGCADGYDEESDIPETEYGETETEVIADYGYYDWDTDTDRMLDRTEWSVWAAENAGWDRYDTDDLEGLGRDEFGEATVEVWDADGDGRISTDEWREGADRWFGEDVDDESWTSWDVDGDDLLSPEEVSSGLDGHGLYDRVDEDDDGLIDDEELADWFFDAIDLDDDEEIDTTEWDQGKAAGFMG